MVKAYPKYQNTRLPWLEKMPDRWQIKRGKAVFRCIDVRSKDGAEELLTVSSKDGVVPRSSKKITMFMAESYVGYKLCWPGDLVINSLWAWMFGLGFSRYHGIVSSAYGVYRPQGQYLDYWKYFDYLFRSKAYDWELRVRSQGIWTSRLQLTDERFLDMPVLIPPKEEVIGIVSFLSMLDIQIRRYIREKQKVINFLNEQNQAIIIKAVLRGINPKCRLKSSCAKWMGDVPEHWDVRKLKFEMNFSGGGTPSKAVESYWDGNIPWVSPKDMKSEIIYDTEDHITEQAVAESSTKIVPQGSILMVVRSGILQRTIPIASCGRPVALNQDIKALTSKGRVNPEYFVLLVRGCEKALLLEWTKQGATVESIEHQFLANSYIPIPPKEEQTAIVQYIKKETASFNRSIDVIKQEIRLLKEYRDRLIADVTTGKIAVNDIKLPEIMALDQQELIEEEIQDEIEDSEEVVNADE